VEALPTANLEKIPAQPARFFIVIDVMSKRMKGHGRRVRIFHRIRHPTVITLFRIQSNDRSGWSHDDYCVSLQKGLANHLVADGTFITRLSLRLLPPGAYTRLEANIRGRHGANIHGRLRLRL